MTTATRFCVALFAACFFSGCFTAVGVPEAPVSPPPMPPVGPVAPDYPPPTEPPTETPDEPTIEPDTPPPAAGELEPFELVALGTPKAQVVAALGSPAEDPPEGPHEETDVARWHVVVDGTLYAARLVFRGGVLVDRVYTPRVDVK